LPMLIVIAGIAIFLIVLDVHLRQDHNQDLFLWLTHTILPSLSDKQPEPVSKVPVQGGLIAILMTVAALWKGFTAFGANPAALLASVAKGNKMKDLEAQTSFRQKFAEEFRDFTTALGQQRPLVIFIDDLDRCLPENVRQILEAVNYLVSSGNCFVILGMDRVQVQRAVGLSFKEVAEEASSNSLGLSPTSSVGADALAELARRKRAEFAQKYLEKLVNLEVRIPLAEEDSVKQKLFENPPTPPPPPLKQRIVQDGLRALKWAVPSALAGLMLFGAIKLSVVAVPGVERLILSTETGPPPQPTPPPSGTTAATGPATAAATGDVAKPAQLKVIPEQPVLIANSSGHKPAITPGKTALPPRWTLSVPFYLVAVFLLLVANVILTTRPGVETHDSQQFTDAMEKIWYPLVLAKQNTPRAAKRFINRVRYLAMRQRGFGETASWWERTLFPDRLPEPATPSQDFIPEPILVALASIEQIEPDWIYDEALFVGLQNDPFQNKATVMSSEKLFKEARKKHIDAFPQYDWRKISEYRKKFLEIWPRVIAADAAVKAAAASASNP